MKVTSFVIVFCLALLVSACKPQNNNPSALNLTIEDIGSNPEKYNGKLVRVRGTFNECASLTCMICQSEAPVDPYSEEFACMGVGFKIPYLEPYARHSTAIIEAIYDSSCTKGMCLDRAQELKQATVIKIVTRRPASKGHISMYGETSLLIPDTKTTEALNLAFKQQSTKVSSYPDPPPEFTFIFDMGRRRESGGYEEIEAMGGVCLCKEGESCQDIWPTLEGHIFNLPYNNPYYCVIAEKANGAWVYTVPQ